MARLSSSVIALALVFFAVPGQAGPGCASRKWDTVQECVQKCSGRWGWAGHAMGTDPWGSVVKIAKDDASMDQMIVDACNVGSSSSVPATSSSEPVINVQPTPSLLPTETSSARIVLSTSASNGSPNSSSAIPSTTSSQASSSSSISHSSTQSSSSLVAASSSSVLKSVLPTVTLSSTANGNSAVLLTSSSVLRTTSTPPPPPSITPSPAPTTSSTPPPPPPPSTTSTPPLPPTTQQPKTTTTQAPPKTTQASNNGNNAAVGSGNTSAADQKVYLDAHNNFRAQHGAGALSWSDELEAAAQKWADKCVFEHSGGKVGPFGENLAAGTGGGFGAAQAVKSWTDESKDFNTGNPQPSHFTQVVWKGTTQLGCAVAQCDGIFDSSFGKAAFYVCEYSAQGNIIGAFALNVQP